MEHKLEPRNLKMFTIENKCVKAFTVKVLFAILKNYSVMLAKNFVSLFITDENFIVISEWVKNRFRKTPEEFLIKEQEFCCC